MNFSMVLGTAIAEPFTNIHLFPEPPWDAAVLSLLCGALAPKHRKANTTVVKSQRCRVLHFSEQLTLSEDGV